MFFNTQRRQNDIIAKLESVLACAIFSVSDDGVMHLQPTAAVLDGNAPPDNFAAGPLGVR